MQNTVYNNKAHKTLRSSSVQPCHLYKHSHQDYKRITTNIVRSLNKNKLVYYKWNKTVNKSKKVKNINKHKFFHDQPDVFA